MAKTIILEYNIFEVLKYVQSFSEGLAAIQTFKMKILFMTTHYCLVFFYGVFGLLQSYFG